MNRAMRAVPLSWTMRRVFMVLLFAGLAAPSLRGQELRIKVLNGRNGKPITNECVNVSLGSWHGGDIIAATNRDGAVVLHLKDNQVIAEDVPSRACSRIAVLGPKTIPNGVDTLAVTSDEYVDCQEWAKVVVGDTPKEVLNRAPSYSIRKILESGVSAGNTCGKFRAKAKPGELIFFVRPPSFWERLKR